MPFDLEKYKQLRMPQSPGAQLASGPAVSGSSGAYKFSFIIAGDTHLNREKNDPPVILQGTRYDPHIIVTGPGTGKEPCPSPTPGPHRDERKGK